MARPTESNAIRLREGNMNILFLMKFFILFITIYVPCGFICPTLISFKVVLFTLAKQTVIMLGRIAVAIEYVRHFVMHKKGSSENILDKKFFEVVLNSLAMSASMQYMG